jgi:hypothetical protein
MSCGSGGAIRWKETRSTQEHSGEEQTRHKKFSAADMALI